MVFIYYKDFKTPNITQFGALAGQIQHGWLKSAYGCSKSRVHAAAAEAGGPNLPVSSSAALKSYIAELSLKMCKLGGPYPRSM
jgi:hypothetical protein